MKKLTLFTATVLFLFGLSAQARECRVALMENKGRGDTIAVFRADSCDLSVRLCVKEKDRLQRSGRYPRAVCVKLDNDRRDDVQASCSYDLIERRRDHRIHIDTYTAIGMGYNYESAKDRACEKAQNRCERDRNYGQSCVYSTRSHNGHTGRR